MFKSCAKVLTIVLFIAVEVFLFGKDESSIEVNVFSVSPSSVTCVDFSPDNKFIAAGTLNGTVHVWEISSGKEYARTQSEGKGLFGAVTSLKYSPTDGILVFGCGDGNIRFWNVHKSKKTSAVGHEGPIKSIAFSADGKAVFLGSTGDYKLSAWEYPDFKHLFSQQFTDGIEAIEAADGWLFVTDSGGIASLSVNSKKKMRFSGLDYRVTCLKLLPGGTRLFSGGGDGVVLWDIENREIIKRFRSPTLGLTSLVIAPDGKYLLAGATNRMIVWDIESGNEKIVIPKLEGSVRVAISGDGKLVASGEFWGKVRIWRLALQ